MIGTIALFELTQRVRRISFLAYYLVFGALAFLIFISSAGAFTGVTIGLGAGGKVYANAPYALHILTNLLAAFGLQLTAAVMGQAVHQDVAARIEPLFFTTPIAPRDYLLGRFLGGIAYLMLMYSSIGVGFLVGSWMPFDEPSLIGPNLTLAFVAPYVTGVLPMLVFTGAIFFTMAALTRQMRAVYATSVVLLAGYLVAMSVDVNPENRVYGALLDPFGIQATEYVTQYWSLADKNERLVPLAGAFLGNRLAWTTVGLAMLTLALRRFRFAHHATEGAIAPEGPATGAHAEARRASPSPSLLEAPDGSWRLLPSLAWLAFRETVKNVYFIVIVLSGVLFLFVSAKDLGSMFGTSTHPVTYQVLELAGGLFSLFMIITIVLFSGELVWRERDQGVDQILDATPIPTALPLAAKLVALGLVQVVLVAVVMLSGLVIQIALGYRHFELGLYLSELFGFMLVRNLLLSVLAVFVHVVVNDKVLGHGVMIGYFLLLQFSRRFGLEHNLYRFSGRPSAIYSDMNGYGHFLRPMVWFDLYWSLFAALLVVFASLLWVRGREDRWRFRLQLARRRLTRSVAAWTGALTLAFSGTGAFIFYNTNVLNRYVTDNGERHELAEYERTYRAHLAEVMPKVVSVDVAYDLFPDERRLEVALTERLRNKSATPISTVYVTETTSAKITELTVGGQKAAAEDSDLTLGSPPGDGIRTRLAPLRSASLGFYTFRLPSPLAPGAEVELTFRGTFSSPGFENGHMNNRIAANGTFVDTQILPFVGYEEALEITDGDDRKKEDLPPKERMHDLHDEKARMQNYVTRDADWIQLHTTVTTSADQEALAPGSLVREESRGDRRTFEYTSRAPFLPYFSMLSARYAVKKDTWRGVAIEVHYHPGHEYNVDRMIQAVKDTFEYLDATIGPYPHDVLRIVEFPRYERFAQSFPTTIPYSESVGFIAKVDPDDEKDVDYPYYVTAHEVAHQWWANQVLGGDVQGATVLSETLSQYTALMTMKRHRALGEMQRFLRFELDRYLRGRSQEKKKELPLVRVENQPYIHYEKGSLVTYALADYIGEETFNRALRTFFEANRYREPPYPTAEGLLEAIRAVTPPEHLGLLEDLFEKITLFELKGEEAKATKLPDGRWRVTAEVRAKKLYADELGHEAEAPLTEAIDVGVLGKKGKLLFLEKRRLEGGRGTFTATVSEEPVRAGIDPLHELVDRDPDDNTAKVELR